jgi:hypothetical protein
MHQNHDIGRRFRAVLAACLTIGLVAAIGLVSSASGSVSSERLRGAPPQLTVADHTRIVQTVMVNALAISKEIGFQKYLSSKTAPSATQVLQAALNLDQVDAQTKDRIRSVLAVQALLSKAVIPPAEKAKVRAIDARIEAARDPTELAATIQELSRQYGSDPGLQVGLTQAAAALKDGLGTIYCFKAGPPCSSVPCPGSLGATPDCKLPWFPPYADPTEGGSLARGIVKSDAKGAVAGAVSGAITGAGAPLGAVAGAAGASAVAVISTIWHWVTGS